jgi:hypothetical protein
MSALSIKVQSYEVTICVIDFAQTNDKIHAEDETLADEALAKVVRPKL